jgi:uncharacterized membrane protein
VVLSFVTWVDRIARLGRVPNTIDRVEKAAARALLERGLHPTLQAKPAAFSAANPPASGPHHQGLPIHAQEVGYLRRIDLAELQQVAETLDLDLVIEALPGAFVTPRRVLARVIGAAHLQADSTKELAAAFRIGNRRTFDDDPRFGLVVLSEIASRALSPAVNDPGTAIHIIGSFVRLFSQWAEASCQREEAATVAPRFNRISVPELALEDLLDDAFQALGRDGAPCLEVGLHLQKGLYLISLLPVPALQTVARAQARLALDHGERALRLAQEVERLRQAAAWILQPAEQGEEPWSRCDRA